MTQLDSAQLDPGRLAALAADVPDTVPLLVDGELDPDGAVRLAALVDDAAAPGRRLVLDLSGVTRLSGAALAVLVAAHCRLRDGGGQLVLAAPSPAVVRVLRTSGLHLSLAVED